MLGAFVKIKILNEIITDSCVLVRNNTEIPCALYPVSANGFFFKD